MTVSDDAVKDAGHGLGAGTDRRAAAISGAPRGSGWAAPFATGKVSAIGASSGTQIFSQTIQLAWPRSAMREPGARSRGAVTAMGSTTLCE